VKGAEIVKNSDYTLEESFASNVRLKIKHWKLEEK
jgi:hypothetical protein